MPTLRLFNLASVILVALTVGACQLVATPTYRRLAPQRDAQPIEDAPILVVDAPDPVVDVFVPEDSLMDRDAGPLARANCLIRGAEVCNGLDDNCDSQIDNNPTDVGAPCIDTSSNPLGVRGTRDANCRCVPVRTPEICRNGVDETDPLMRNDACMCDVYLQAGRTAMIGSVRVVPTVAAAQSVLATLAVGVHTVCLLTPTVGGMCDQTARPFPESIPIARDEQWVGGFRDIDGMFMGTEECRTILGAPVIFDAQSNENSALVNVVVRLDPSANRSTFAVQMRASGTVSRSSVFYMNSPTAVTGIGNVTSGAADRRVLDRVTVSVSSRGALNDSAAVALVGGTAILNEVMVTSAADHVASGVVLSNSVASYLRNTLIGTIQGTTQSNGLALLNPQGPVRVEGFSSVARALVTFRSNLVDGLAFGIGVQCMATRVPVVMSGVQLPGASAFNVTGMGNDGCELSVVGTRDTPSVIAAAAVSAQNAIGFVCRSGTCLLDGVTVRGANEARIPTSVARNVGVFVEPAGQLKITGSTIIPTVPASEFATGIDTAGTFYGERVIIDPSLGQPGLRLLLGLSIHGGPAAELTDSVIRVARGTAVGVLADQIRPGSFGILFHSNTVYQIADSLGEQSLMVAVSGPRLNGARFEFSNNIVAPTYNGLPIPLHIGICATTRDVFSVFEANLLSGASPLLVNGPSCLGGIINDVDGVIAYLSPIGGRLFEANANLMLQHHIGASSPARGLGRARNTVGHRDIDDQPRPLGGFADIGADEID